MLRERHNQITQNLLLHTIIEKPHGSVHVHANFKSTMHISLTHILVHMCLSLLQSKPTELHLWVSHNATIVFFKYIYMGQCPAKSGLWGYNYITIKIARCTKQHIFATVLRFPFKFRTLVPTPFLCVKIDFCDLQRFRAVNTTIVNPAVRNPHFSTYEC